MSTWVGAIVETRGRPDLWTVAARHGIAPATTATPNYVLIDFDIDFEASFRVAEAMSRELQSMALGFIAQTTSDVYEMRAFDSGTSIRRLAFSRDNGGWEPAEGLPQPWERAFFFDDRRTDSPEEWPDMLRDDVSDEDIARFEAARRAGEVSDVLELMDPGSTEPLHRVCAFFEVTPDRPHGRWKKPSLLSRLFRRGE